MPNERFTSALSRLEAAAIRLEGLARARIDTETPPGNNPDLAALAERHRRLREGAAEALARLDRLISGGGGA